MLTPIRKPTLTRGRYAYHNIAQNNYVTCMIMSMLDMTEEDQER